MSVLAGLFDDLNHLSLVQLLLAFTACIASALALGALLAPRPRLLAAAAALGSLAAFAATSASWPNAVMLAAIGVAGLGVFTAAVLLLTRLTGQAPGANAGAARPDSAWPADDTPGAQSGALAHRRRRRSQIPST